MITLTTGPINATQSSSIGLSGIRSVKGFRPLRVEYYEKRWPLALLKYALNNVEQELGLRLDLGKLDENGNILVLDRPDDPALVSALKRVLPSVRKRIAESLP